ncbi:L-threonylcarbamoyladenylate synthase [Bifidobacterium choloepi]|uniref:L-threonylcarbamoyladenylate synthase n=1 Tax=Bifidobacterium choloepi TaxID=2614131 RepID=A0A6I5NDM9_9BIFI|nr:L-threonylcarbamoyladenylate synthase [Bifidobacterium choloepi]NEG69514.1 L-threonylcarbamoyladenylate synthase [Bifidobacterium choloepi]
MADVRKVTDESLERAREVIRGGGLVVIPTDTVYGVACDPRNAAAIEKIYRAKGRPKFKALQVVMASVDELGSLGLALPAPLNRLAAQFLPGAFSPICLAEEGCELKTVSRNMTTGQLTQGIRVPNSAVSLRILRAVGPVACSSANLSGGESAQSVEEAVAAFEGAGYDSGYDSDDFDGYGEASSEYDYGESGHSGSLIDLYLDGGPTQGHVASTVVAADPYATAPGGDGIEILREGVIPGSVIRKALHMNGGGLGA